MQFPAARPSVGTAASPPVGAVRLLSAFLREQSDPDRFYGLLARDSVALVERRVPLRGARVVDVGGSVIIDMLAPPRPRLLRGDAQSLRLPITFRPSDRCDPHSLSQSQQTFLLSAYVRVGDAPVVRLILPLSHRVHAQLQHMIDTYCT